MGFSFSTRWDAASTSPFAKVERTGGAFGSRAGHEVQLEPDVRYRGVVYFPRLPRQVKRITVLSPAGDTTGEFTGIPVVDRSGTPSIGTSVGQSTQPSTPKPGQPVKLPARAPSGDVWSDSDALYGITDSSSARSNVSSPGKQKVELRADVLFAFDSAKLSDKAKAVIREIAPEITQRADPSKPVTVEGHTDNKGSDAYNKDLSGRRAKAVHEELTSALSDSRFQFKVSGKGESEPVAENASEDGRARNRRVEIEYATKPPGDTPRTSPPASPAAPGSPVTGAPASFHADDGEVVAKRQATVDAIAHPPTDLTLEVHPFYRDGAYLVAVFEMSAAGDFTGTFQTPEFAGANFGSFTVVDAATQSRSYEVRVGESDDSIYYIDAGRPILHGGDTHRYFAYYPAPPVDVEKVTFDAGPFGEIKNVPIR